jgi:hypothetical protein
MVVLLLLAGRGYAQPYQFDNFIYNLPGPEWNRGKVTPEYIILYPDKFGVYVHLFASSPYQSDLGTWAINRLKEFDRKEAEEDKKEPPPILKTDTKETQLDNGTKVTLVSQIVEKRGIKYLRLAMAFPSSGKADLIMMEGRDVEKFKSHTPAFINLVSNVQRVSAGAKPVLGKPTPGGLDGIWLGTTTGYGLNGLEVTTQFYLFSKTGRFVSDIIAGEPLVGFDFEKAVRRHSAEAGNYTIANGKITLHYADGEKEVEEFKRSTSNKGEPMLKIDNVSLFRITPPADGARLSGTYNSTNYSSFTPGSGVSGGVVSTRTYTFRPDGTFLFDKFAGASANFENSAGDTTGGFATRKSTDDAGTYTIKDGLLILKTKEGKEIRHNILFYDKELIYLDGSSYLGKDKKK